jgi:hypothetical protein
MAVDSIAVIAAREWASQLAALGGLLPRAAAVLAAKRYGVRADELYVDVEPHVVHAWRMGSLMRPTSSPHQIASGERV